jgi:hypothetical protein
MGTLFLVVMVACKNGRIPVKSQDHLVEKFDGSLLRSKSLANHHNAT